MQELDYTSPNVNALIAARLFYFETPLPGETREEREEYAEKALGGVFSPHSFDAGVKYGLVEQSGNLLGAASVMHEHPHRTPRGGKRFSLIRQLVVHPDVRRRGHGTTMVRQIAERALAHGDQELVYFTDHHTDLPYEDPFMRSLGFEETGQSWMQVAVSEILARGM